MNPDWRLSYNVTMAGDPEIQNDSELKKPVDRIEPINLTNNAEIIVAGIGSHTTNLNEIKGITGALEKLVGDRGSENIVFLGEGSAVSAGTKQESTASAILGGDQQAIACRAKELGVEIIESWDMTLEEQLTAAAQTHGADNALLWMISQSTIALKSQGEYVSINNILAMLSKFELTQQTISDSLSNQEVKQALENQDSLDIFLQAHAGFSLTEVNENDTYYKTISQVAHPGNTTETISHLPDGLQNASLIAGELSETRDDRFKSKIEQYSQQGKSIFISCGAGHVDNFLKILNANKSLAKY